MYRQLKTAVTSPIPGAQATVLPGGAGAAAEQAPAGFCVTDAGYCPLAAPVEAGRNCLCEAANGTYGGKTGPAPKPYQP
jgi:hypothetical protein